MATVAIALVGVVGLWTYRYTRAPVSLEPQKNAEVPHAPVREAPVLSVPATSAPSAIEPTAEPLPSASPLPIADSYLVSVASFRSAALAERLTMTLVEQGWPAFIRHEDNGRWHAVLLGPYLTMDEAREARQRIDPVTFDGSRIVKERAAARMPEPR